MTSIRTGTLLFILILGSQAALWSCSSRSSPSKNSSVTVHPAESAMEDPCRFMGSVHREVRIRLDVFRSHDVISFEQWKCLTAELKAVDKEMTARCDEQPQTIEIVNARQTELFGKCLPSSDEAIIHCSLLSSDRACVEERCCNEDPPTNESR